MALRGLERAPGSDPLHRLTGDLGNSVEVGVVVEHGQRRQLGDGCDEDCGGVGNEATDDAYQWHVAASYTLGNTLFYLGYGEAEELRGDDYEHTGITIGLDHKFSKRTDVYAGWTQTDVDDDNQPNVGETDVVTVGLRHKF